MSNRPSQLTLEALKALQAQQRSLAHSGHPLLAGYTAAWHSPEVGGSAGGSTTDPLTEGPASPTAAGAANSLATHVSHPSSVGSAVMGTSSAAVDIKPWLLPFSDLDLHSRVGDGSHGTVSLGGVLVAIWRIHPPVVFLAVLCTAWLASLPGNSCKRIAFRCPLCRCSWVTGTRWAGLALFQGSNDNGSNLSVNLHPFQQLWPLVTPC